VHSFIAILVFNLYNVNDEVTNCHSFHGGMFSCIALLIMNCFVIPSNAMDN
jgi:hypothetical protein